MPGNATLVPVLKRARITGLSTSQVLPFIPVRTGERGLGGERTSAGKRAILQVLRSRDGTTGALDGTIAVYGADLSHPVAGRPLGNAFAQTPTATAVRPQVDIIAGDGTTTGFTTNIDLASGDLAAAIAGTSLAVLVELPKWRIAVTSTLAALTATMTAAGVITTSAAFDTALAGGALEAGDTLELAGQTLTVVSASGSTINVTGATAAVTVGAPLYVTTKRRRFLKVVAGSAGVASDEVEATVSNSKLVLTFKVAPPAIGPNASGTPAAATARGALPTDVPAVHLVTPTQILADSANELERVGIRSRSAVWAIATATAAGDVSATQVLIEHASE
jgi:hypothetical protein